MQYKYQRTQARNFYWGDCTKNQERREGEGAVFSAELDAADF
jgi:hypothetical protein